MCTIKAPLAVASDRALSNHGTDLSRIVDRTACHLGRVASCRRAGPSEAVPDMRLGEGPLPRFDVHRPDQAAQDGNRVGRNPVAGPPVSGRWGVRSWLTGGVRYHPLGGKAGTRGSRGLFRSTLFFSHILSFFLLGKERSPKSPSPLDCRKWFHGCASGSP